MPGTAPEHRVPRPQLSCCGREAESPGVLPPKFPAAGGSLKPRLVARVPAVPLRHGGLSQGVGSLQPPMERG